MTFFITYIFRSEHGILSTCYPASQLEDFGGQLCCEFNGWKEMKKISLREAAKHQAQSLWNLFTANACKCTTGCRTKQCRCLKKNLGCTSHCHAGKQCSNQQDTKLFCANESKVQQKNFDIEEKNEMASKKRVSWVSKNINSIELKSCILMASSYTGALTQIIESHAK